MPFKQGGYGSERIRNSWKKTAVGVVGSAYGFTGAESDTNQDNAKWLLEKGRFLCGEINIQVS